MEIVDWFATLRPKGPISRGYIIGRLISDKEILNRRLAEFEDRLDEASWRLANFLTFAQSLRSDILRAHAGKTITRIEKEIEEIKRNRQELVGRLLLLDAIEYAFEGELLDE